MDPATTDCGTLYTASFRGRKPPFVVPQQWRIGLTGRHLESSRQEELLKLSHRPSSEAEDGWIAVREPGASYDPTGEFPAAQKDARRWRTSYVGEDIGGEPVTIPRESFPPPQKSTVGVAKGTISIFVS